jgi:cytochrome c553
VHDIFCAETTPQFDSLSELQAAFGVDTASISGFAQASQGHIVDIAVSGHSTGLSGRSVSAINPRVIATRMDLLTSDFSTVAFTRGEQFVELFSRDRLDRSLHFYLLVFQQRCNSAADGCNPGDLLTPAVEQDWTETSLYDESDVKNTVLDCTPCHQPNGPGTPKMLRMQELDTPWTHWFWRNSAGGRALLADYSAAKGDEGLAGMTAQQIANTEPESLSTLVLLTDPTQPNEFESAAIENEVQASAAGQPEDNSIPGQSTTWRLAYERAQRGEAITVPYHDVKVTDPLKLERMTTAYQAFRRGELARELLPDLRAVYPDSLQVLAELGVASEPALDGRATLLATCSPCHSARLDPTVSRARFRADLEGLSRAEKDVAIARLKLSADHPLAMPPARLRILSPDARARAIDALR